MLRTHVGIIIDKSGSMTGRESQVISGFKEQLDELRKSSSDDHFIGVTLTIFSDDVGILRKDDHIDRVADLTMAEYQPSGLTSLMDAVGDTITTMQSYPNPKDDNAAYLLVVITDGDENSSHRYSKSKIAAMTKQCQDSGNWTFVYIGTEMDLTDATKTFATDAASVMAFDDRNYRATSESITKGFVGYMSSRARGNTTYRGFFDGNDTDEKDS